MGIIFVEVSSPAGALLLAGASHLILELEDHGERGPMLHNGLKCFFDTAHTLQEGASTSCGTEPTLYSSAEQDSF